MNYSARFLFFFLFFLGACNILFGQTSNVILFTENGEKFSVILNGVLQNPIPETNVKVTDLPAPTYKLKILFEDSKLPSVEKTLNLGKELEMTFCIKKNNKGLYTVRFQNQIAIHLAPPPPPSQRVFPYTTVQAVSGSVTTQSQATVTTLSNVNNSGGTINITINSEANSGKAEEPHDHYNMPGYHGPVGCPYPMTDLDFNDVKKSVSEKSFEESKLNVAKQVTSANCLFASEVKEIMELFSFETTKLEFAKFAYRYTFDIGNYYKVNDAFHFESSINELNEFLQSKSSN